MSFVTDSFTDADNTLLSAHTGELGATWTKKWYSSFNAKIISNQLRSAYLNCTWYASGTPASAEYDVEAKYVSGLIGPNDFIGPAGRMSTTADTFYTAGAAYTGGYKLLKCVAESFTLLGSYGTSAGNTVVKLEIRDAAKKLYVDGVERVSSSDNAITAAGKAGFYNYDQYNSGLLIDNFSASDPSGGATYAPPPPRPALRFAHMMVR